MTLINQMVFINKNGIQFFPVRGDKRSLIFHMTWPTKEGLNCCSPYETGTSVGFKSLYYTEHLEAMRLWNRMPFAEQMKYKYILILSYMLRKILLAKNIIIWWLTYYHIHMFPEQNMLLLIIGYSFDIYLVY